jgi:hypothetical protein
MEAPVEKLATESPGFAREANERMTRIDEH